MNRAVACLRFIFFAAICTFIVFGQANQTSDSEKVAVLKVEEAFRLAKLQNDTAGLKRILAPEYVGVNQYGARRDKAGLIELFQYFKLASLVLGEVDVRFAGGVAIVMGTQTEENPASKEKHIFTRVYVKRDGQWQLLSSTQLIPSNT